ncbi:ABC transporter ATP-binding protein [Alkaliphilus sp. MSJ-5]|uniref:ABC transporter ATP-binding protein n=1 Tax=Alkaliphilus flagellatus TaxID=2841507 RepID=A0ABS6FXW8_9FIRM|nr:ABC transporter ATP-binding protein [Alkaliphilus flagellatus]MBU5675070.1 ABC transporter ATP-binding protein [Alkaliphilus flagellatus]
MELRINNLTRQYGNKIAVDNFSATLTPGVYGLLGANGMGKTTLMRLVCDILKPSAGEITYDGVNITELGEDYRDILSYLPQQFGYYPDFSAYDYMMYLASLKGLKRFAARKKTLELLETVGLIDEKKHKIKTFSGGMRQRLGIAQAMLNDPKILVLDEPTAGLDPKERVKFRNLISSFSRERIIILSTHIVSDIEYIADEILVIKGGQLLSRGNVHSITEAIEGFVWEITVSAEAAKQMNTKFIISNLKHRDEYITLRIVATNKPHEEAINVSPNLEDLYLYYFQEEESNDNINQL